MNRPINVVSYAKVAFKKRIFQARRANAYVQSYYFSGFYGNQNLYQ